MKFVDIWKVLHNYTRYDSSNGISIPEFYSLEHITKYNTTDYKENNGRNDVIFDSDNIVSTPCHSSFLDA